MAKANLPTPAVAKTITPFSIDGILGLNSSKSESAKVEAAAENSLAVSRPVSSYQVTPSQRQFTLASNAMQVPLVWGGGMQHQNIN